MCELVVTKPRPRVDSPAEESAETVGRDDCKKAEEVTLEHGTGLQNHETCPSCMEED